MNYPTPHINATPDDFGQTVLMPGDPLRSKYIAEHFLENARLVNNVRGVQGYTGTYHGVKVSVMASGMGIPSIGIYSYELYNAFGVQNIMRIGSAGSINPDIHVRDIVIAQGACTDSNFLHQYHIDGTFAPIASYEMLRRAVASCEQVGATYHVGNVLSTDNFYNDDEGMPEVLQTVPAWIKMGVMACEMEAARPVYDRRPLEEERPVHLHDLRSHAHGRGPARRGAPDVLHADDGGRARNGRQTGKVI